VSDDIQAILGRVSGGANLAMAEMSQVVDSIMSGQWTDEQIALLLNALRQKGETVEEVAGAATAMRQHMTPIETSRRPLIDTCGTGGDGSGTFNISTAAALVTAAAGVPVAKHGNRSITSKSGSSEVLAALGVNIEASVATVTRCLDEVGICFCFAPQMHPAMKHVAAARRSLAVPTIFNMLGPLCNPASAPFQLLGVGRPELRPLLSQALTLLGTERTVVVCGAGGLDEVTLSGMTDVSEVRDGAVSETRWQPSNFRVAEAPLNALRVDGPAASADMIRAILDGKMGPSRDIVVVNAAAALWTAGEFDDLPAAAQRAAEAIDQGDAKRLLEQFVEASRA
jgi:anthranilate phosphoribosyltransferase